MPFSNPSPTTLIVAQPVSASIAKSNIGTFSTQSTEYVSPPLVIDQGNTYLDRETAGSAFIRTSTKRLRPTSGKSRSDALYGMSTASPEILMRFTTDDLSPDEFEEYARCVDLEIRLDTAQSDQFFSSIESNSSTSYQERSAIVETIAEEARSSIFSMSDALDSIDEMSESVTIGASQYSEGTQAKYTQNLETISDSIVSNVNVRNPSLSFGPDKSSGLFEYITSLQETKTQQYQRMLTGSISATSFVKEDRSFSDTLTSIDRAFSTLSQVLRKTIGESQVSNALIQSSSATILGQFKEIGSFPFDGSASDENRSAKTLGFEILDNEDYTSLNKTIDLLSNSESFTENLIINSALNIDDERYTPVGLFLRIMQATVNSNSSVADANTSLTIDNPGQVWDSYLTTLAIQGGESSNNYTQFIADSLINSIDGTSSSGATTTIADTLIEDDSAEPSKRRIKSTTVVQNSSASSIDDIVSSSEDTNIVAALYAASILLPPSQQVFYAQTISSTFESSAYTVYESEGGKRESEFPRIGALEYFESFKTYLYSGMYYSSGVNANDEIYTRLKKYGSLDSGTVTSEIKNFYNEIIKDISALTGLDSSDIEKNGFAGVTRKNLLSLIIICFAHAISVTLRPKFLRIDGFGSSATGEGQNIYALSFPRGSTNLIRSIRDCLKTSGTVDEITQSVYLTYTSDPSYSSTRWVNEAFSVISRYIKIREERHDSFVKNILWAKSIVQYLGETLTNFKERIGNNMAQLESAASSVGVDFPIKHIRRNTVAARSFSLEHDFLLSSNQSLQRMKSELYVAKSYVMSAINGGPPIDFVSIGLPSGFSETLINTTANFGIRSVRLDGVMQTEVQITEEIIDTSIFVAFDGIENEVSFFDILGGEGVIFHWYNENEFVDATYQEMIDAGHNEFVLKLIIASAAREATVKLLSSVSLGQTMMTEVPFISSEGADFFIGVTGGPASTYFSNSGLQINQLTEPYSDGWKVIPFSNISGTGTSLIDESSLRLCMRILNDPLFTAETIAKSIVEGPSIERIYNMLLSSQEGYTAMSSNVTSIAGSLPMRQPIKEIDGNQAQGGTIYTVLSAETSASELELTATSFR